MLCFLDQMLYSSGYPVTFNKNQLIGCRIAIKTDLTFFRRGYNFFINFTLCNIIPLVLTAFFYYKVVKKVKERKVIGGQVSEERQTELKKNKRKTTEMLIALVTWYFIISVPFYLMGLIKIFFLPKKLENRCTEDYVFPIETYAIAGVFLVGCVLINPFIIFHYNPDFKLEAYRVLRMKKREEQSKDTHLQEIETGST
jgi:hypothetical protein